VLLWILINRHFILPPHTLCLSFTPRMQRHADAIFTDNYRKFLGQISARKFLQTIIGKRLGRQSDSILMDSRYHQQMVLRDFLGAILQNQR
uniref:Somatoliberin n=1 Tax=Buteo japonicus TaxID=224669 RepID=A0A8C0BF85_9AVES